MKSQLNGCKPKERLVQIIIGYGDFHEPVKQFEKILKMISPDEIKTALIRASGEMPDDSKQVDDWNLHLYTEDTRISFYDSIAGYDGDSPRCKTFKILKMAGFEIDVEELLIPQQDFLLSKE